MVFCLGPFYHQQVLICNEGCAENRLTWSHMQSNVILLGRMTVAWELGGLSWVAIAGKHV